MGESIQGVEGTADISDILKDAVVEAKNLTEELGRATLSPTVDIEAVKKNMINPARAAADAFKEAFERRLRENPPQMPPVRGSDRDGGFLSKGGGG
jgi:hypothetical protein